ncbi:MAG: hypothetical protein OHK0039_23610 [Bacteroidia bacterium]
MGAVYVWKRTPVGEWLFQQKLTPVNRDSLDRFGYSIAMYGAYAIIAAPYKWVKSGTRGVAYVYKRDDQGYWQEMDMLYVPQAHPEDGVGTSVALHGRLALISAPGDTYSFGNGGAANGAAYVFERDSLGETWTQIAKLWEPDSSHENYAGRVLSIEGNYAALCTHREPEDENGLNTFSGSGAVYLFERDSSGTWQFHQKLVDPYRHIYAGTFFGHSAAFDQGQLLVGARLHPSQDSQGVWRSGAVFVFERDTQGVWRSIQRIIPEDQHPQGHGFGSSLAARNGAMVIGAPFAAYQIGPYRGAIYFYERQADGTWAFINKAYEPRSLAGPNNLFGVGSLAIDGPSAIAGTSGAPGVNNDEPFNYAYHYEQCRARHQVINLTACEPMDYYGHWLGSTGLYQDLAFETDWGCDSLTADVLFEITAVDTAVVRLGDTLVATADGASFQWLRCGVGYTPIPGATGPTFVPDSLGFYAVEVTQQGCSAVSACRLVLALTRQTPSLASQVRLYPNPGKGQVQIDLSGLAQPTRLRVFDTQGRLLHTRTAQPTLTDLDLRTPGRGPGLYLLHLQTGSESATLRLLWE